MLSTDAVPYHCHRIAKGILATEGLRVQYPEKNDTPRHLIHITYQILKTHPIQMIIELCKK